MYSQSGVFRLTDHLPVFFYFVVRLPFSSSFFFSHNTYARTGMTTIDDILSFHKMKRETMFRLLAISLYVQPSGTNLILFFVDA
jgi:hypothetical protein